MGQPQITPQPPVTPPSRAAFRFAVLFVLAELAALALCLWAAAQPWFLDHDAYPVLRMMGYGARAQGVACDIVVYGDSTALDGIDPAIIQARTGLKTCNIAEARPVIETVGTDEPLLQYLAHNPAPKVLLTAWTPSNFQLEFGHFANFAPEGYLYALQYARGPWLWRGMARSPLPALRFLLWAQSRLILDAVQHLPGFHPQPATNERARRDSLAGRWPYRMSAETRCAQVVPYRTSTRAQNLAGVAEFRRRFSRNGTRVLVDTTPVADCIAILPTFPALTEGIADNHLEVLPISNFLEQDIHLTDPAAQRFSAELADQIIATLNTPVAAP